MMGLVDFQGVEDKGEGSVFNMYNISYHMQWNENIILMNFSG